MKKQISLIYKEFYCVYNLIEFQNNLDINIIIYQGYFYLTPTRYNSNELLLFE
ncbi:hypothetical protein [Clostridium gasigenes]|uniref:hypothetical protein n=1 Tax=Clostridium gasigenes TaxID=94869 RepID=UPI001A9B7745|nr:hypothetical protein [Clostridium gasigenes]